MQPKWRPGRGFQSSETGSEKRPGMLDASIAAGDDIPVGNVTLML